MNQDLSRVENIRICLILPSLSSGGLERVISELANYFSSNFNFRVSIICLSKGILFYPISDNINVYMPSFSSTDSIKPFYLVNLLSWVRRQIKSIRPDIVLSFGGKFNSFILISVLFMNIRVFISDRSRPSISYGRLLDILNSITYKNATGIIAQTNFAKELLYSRLRHPNIEVIGNPVVHFQKESVARDNIILNVGRFIPSKQQELLVRFFAQLQPTGWKLVFLGDGQTLEHVKKTAEVLKLNDKVEFLGAVKEVDYFYNRCKIFAFTSISEGFPNALGEAMAAGMACISFDCEAGPSDLIDDNVNGFLVSKNDYNSYISKLQILIENQALCDKFGQQAIEKVSQYSLERIGNHYLRFLTGRDS